MDEEFVPLGALTPAPATASVAPVSSAALPRWVAEERAAGKETAYDTGAAVLDLHEEIMDFQAFVQRSFDTEDPLRSQMAHLVAVEVRKLWPKAVVETFGSTAVALYVYVSP
jgi:hypothetical protein